MALPHLTIRAVIFDVYGTLLEVGPPPADGEVRWQRLCTDMLQVAPRLTRLGFSIACHHVIARHHAASRALGVPWPEVDWMSVVAEVLPEIGELPRPEQAEFVVRQIQTGHITHMREATAGALRWLMKHGVLLGIASNAQAYTLRELDEGLAGHGLGMDLFDRALCFWSFEHGFSKPDPHVFQILNARLIARGVRPSEILMVGDRHDNDIAPARAYGWQTWQLGPKADGDWDGLRAIVRPAEPETSA